MNLYAKFDKYFDKLSRKNMDCPTQVLVWSDNNKIDYKYSATDYNQPFHIASIGKVMTASVVGILSDKGLLNIDDLICNYLSDDIIRNLFIYKSVDYKSQITIRHLLNHTSGIADYFESKTNAGSSFVDRIMDMPDKIWSPMDLINFTRDNQNAKSAPGSFLYSDTGYVLLGLIIEKVAKMPFHEVLSQFIFKPLNMKDSYLLFGGQPINQKQAIANVWFGKKEISRLNMLSCDWAGGGIISTLSDLLLFQKAFWNEKVVSAKYISEMTNINNKFRAGMHYGSGMMELRFDGFFFLLKGMSRPMGHSGILGTLMFYDKPNDTHIIMNLGSNKRVIDSFKAIIVVEQLVGRFVKSS